MVNKLVVFIVGFLLMGRSSFAGSIDKIIVIVNNQVITQTELDNRIHQVKMNLTAVGEPIPPEAELREKILNTLIDQSLQLQLAKRAKIGVSSEELNRALQEVASRNNQTVATLKTFIEKQGMTYSDFGSELKDQLILQRLQGGEIASKIKISDVEIEALAAKLPPPKGKNSMGYHIQSIFMPLPETANAAQVSNAKMLADDLAQQFRERADLKQIAVIKSTLAIPIETQDWGWHALTDLPDLYAAEVERMQLLQVVGPIRAGNGFHIIKLVGSQGAHPSQLSSQERRNQAKQLLFEKKFSQALEAWVKQLRQGAYINII